MVRSCTRSRGCKECRQRKVKCDETLPACSQCVLRGNECPGPITGPVFVSMNQKTKNRVVAKRDRVDRRQKPNIPSNDAMNIPSSSISDVLNTNPSTAPQLARSRSQLHLPSSYQPSRAAPFQELFLGHFISTFNNRNLQRTSRESWYEELPRILHTSQCQTVIASIRAVTMVHYGVITANMPVQTEAYRWYAKALKGQRIVVQKDWQGLSSRMPTGEEVLPPILFALFELVTLTTPTGFAEHIVAAAALLQLRKPENCQDGLAHLFFRTVRISLVYCCLYKEEQHIFATYPWTTIPFTVHPKTLLDRLVDILLLIPSSLSLYNQANGFQGPDMRENQTIRRNLESTASTQLQCLHSWWQEYTADIAKQRRSGANVLHSVGTVGDPSTSEETYYRDTFTATCRALFHAGNVILYSMLSFTSPQPHSYDYSIESHAGHIISAASYLITNGTCSSGRLMIVFPLKTVSRWTVDGLQRQSALDLLREWGRENGISGICSQGQ